MEKVTSKVPFHKISWENIYFCGLKKETLISNGRKISVNSSPSGHFFPSYVFPLKFKFKSDIFKSSNKYIFYNFFYKSFFYFFFIFYLFIYFFHIYENVEKFVS